jgi:uncharacterized protein YlbG (UPF0298 family)
MGNFKAERILTQIDRKLIGLKSLSRMIKGTVYKVVRKRAGKSYDGYQLNYKDGKNTTRTIYVQEQNVKKVERMIKRFKTVRKIISEILELNTDLIRNGIYD